MHLEAQQRSLNGKPHFKPVATVHDSGLNQARFIIKRRLQQEAAMASPATPQKISP